MINPPATVSKSDEQGRVRSIFASAVLAVALGLIAVLAIPVMIAQFLISATASVADRLIAWIER